MSYDKFGQQFLTEKELIKMMHINPSMDLGTVMMDFPNKYNEANKALYADYPTIEEYIEPGVTIEEFDYLQQGDWSMPERYKEMDIEAWLVEQCKTAEELNRIAEELIFFRQKGLLSLLQFVKYTIDTFREKNIVWGVGRGSSVSSYVLFLIGVHKVDSIKYDLDIKEFLR